MKIQHILVPLDGSSLSQAALVEAKKIALALKARLILLRVGEVLAPEVLAIPEISLALTTELQRQELKVHEHLLTYLEEQAKPLRELGLDVTTEVRLGNPAAQIVELSESQGVDLVVMSSHGRTGLQRWIYGSVAERVLHNVACSLMVVRIAPDQLNS